MKTIKKRVSIIIALILALSAFSVTASAKVSDEICAVSGEAEDTFIGYVKEQFAAYNITDSDINIEVFKVLYNDKCLVRFTVNGFGYTTDMVTERIGRYVERIGLVAKRIHVRTTALNVPNRENEVSWIEEVYARHGHLACDLPPILRDAIRINDNVTIALQSLSDAQHYVLLQTRNEHRYRLVNNLLDFATEILHCAWVDLKDMPVRVSYDYGIIHPRQELTEKRSTVFWYKHSHFSSELYHIRR